MPLSSFVKSISIIEENSGYDIHVKAFPVGYPYINVLTASAFQLEKDTDQLSTHSYLCGQTLVPFDLKMPLVDRSLLIQFQPWGLNAILPWAAYDYLDCQVPLESVDKDLSHELEDLLAGSLGSNEVILRVENCLLKRIDDPAMDQRIFEAWKHIVKQKGNLKISDIAGEVNLSERRLQQLFSETIGMSPKTGMGYYAIFDDSEGNRVGFYSTN